MTPLTFVRRGDGGPRDRSRRDTGDAARRARRAVRHAASALAAAVGPSEESAQRGGMRGAPEKHALGTCLLYCRKLQPLNAQRGADEVELTRIMTAYLQVRGTQLSKQGEKVGFSQYSACGGTRKR